MKKSNCFTFVILLALLPLLPLLFTACAKSSVTYVDGFYTAEMDAFDDHGWKEFITLYVSGGRIVTVEYNAKNQSGMIKSWDMNYMRTMNRVAGSYPNQYTRAYAADLLKNQNADHIDAVSGATHSYHTFDQLSAAVLALAHNGNEQIVFVTAQE